MGKGCGMETGCPGDGSSLPPAVPGVCCPRPGVWHRPRGGEGKNLPSLSLPHCRGAQQASLGMGDALLQGIGQVLPLEATAWETTLFPKPCAEPSSASSMRVSARRCGEPWGRTEFPHPLCLLPVSPGAGGAGVLRGVGSRGRCSKAVCRLAPWLWCSPTASRLLENDFHLWPDLHFSYTLSRRGRGRQCQAGGSREFDKPAHDCTQTTLRKGRRRKRGCLFSQLCLWCALLLVWAGHSLSLHVHVTTVARCLGC